MLYHATKRVGEVLAANFDADMAAIVTGSGEAGLWTQAQVESFRTGENMRKEITAAAQAVIGVFAIQALAEIAKPGGANVERQSTNTVVAEYVTVGADHAKVTKQTMFAAEAMLRSIDRIPGTGQVVEAGAARNSIQVTIAPTSLVKGKRAHWSFARVEVPVDVIDTI